MDFELKLFLDSIPALFRGALTTAKLTLISATIGLSIGVILGLFRVSDNFILRYFSFGYITIFRGLPLLVTLLFLYYGLPSIDIQLTSFAVAVIALSLTNGAYVTEIVRSGIQSIEPGQMKAARSLGMSYSLAMRRIVMPQALRRVLPPITNESITLLKNTALVSTIALTDLLRAGMNVMTWKANTFSPFAGVALFYLIMTISMQALTVWIERKYRIR